MNGVHHRQSKEIGTFINEKELMVRMINDVGREIKIKFQPTVGELIEIGASHGVELEGGSIVIVDESIKMEVTVKKKISRERSCCSRPSVHLGVYARARRYDNSAVRSQKKSV